VSKTFGLARDPFGLITFEAARKHLFDQVATEPALDLSGRSFLGQLERKDGRAVLEGAAPAVRIDGLLVNPNGEEAEHVQDPHELAQGRSRAPAGRRSSEPGAAPACASGVGTWMRGGIPSVVSPAPLMR